MNPKLLEQMSVVTEEEKRLLDGDAIDEKLYSRTAALVVDKDRLLKEGQLITIRPHTRFSSFPEHSHNYVEIIYMCSGSTRHCINQTDWLELQTGELLIFSPSAKHRIEKAEKDDIAVNFIVLPHFFDLALQMIGSDNILGRFLLGILGRENQNMAYLHCKVSASLPIQNILENMVWGFVNQEVESKKVYQYTMGLLFMHLLNEIQDLSLVQSKGHAHELVLSVLSGIEENYPYVTLLQYAKQHRVSLAYLSRVIKQGTGKTFKELLQEKRFGQAVKLLKESDLPIEGIIHAVGYSNSSYFYRSFLKKFGISPSQYRLFEEQ